MKPTPTALCPACRYETFVDRDPVNGKVKIREHYTQDPVERAKAVRNNSRPTQCPGSRKAPIPDSIRYPLIAFGEF